MNSPAQTEPKRRAPTKRRKDAPLNEQDWIAAATQILVRENVRGVKLDVLCKKLGVTKGSFYWHFASRNELLLAMLSDWRKRTTLNVIRTVSKGSEDAKKRLYSLLELTRKNRSPAFAQIEFSIRDWARRVEMPRSVVTEVDQIRFDYFKSLFMELGFDGAEAETRAYVTYCVMMGDSMLHHTLPHVAHEDFLARATDLITRTGLDKP